MKVKITIEAYVDDNILLGDLKRVIYKTDTQIGESLVEYGGGKYEIDLLKVEKL